MNTNGHFGFYSLTDWWDLSLTDQEKTRFKEMYKPMGGTFKDLFEGSGGYERSIVWFLTVLAGFLTSKSDAHLALKFLNRAEESVGMGTILDKHFLYSQLLETHYKLRLVKEHYDFAKHYCALQNSLAPDAAELFLKEYGPTLPSHLGFRQYAIILEKEKRFEEALEVCSQASSQGWRGDWVDRIRRLQDRGNGT